MISVDEIRAICFARHHSKKPLLSGFTGFARSDEPSFPSLEGHGPACYIRLGDVPNLAYFDWLVWWRLCLMWDSFCGHGFDCDGKIFRLSMTHS